MPQNQTKTDKYELQKYFIFNYNNLKDFYWNNL